MMSVPVRRPPGALGHGNDWSLERQTRRVWPTALPPYGREVIAALSAGWHPNVRLYACVPDPWEPAKRHRRTFGTASTLVLPPGAKPETFRWPPLTGLVADVTGLGGNRVMALAHALVVSGVTLSYLFDRNQPQRDLRVLARRGDE